MITGAACSEIAEGWSTLQGPMVEPDEPAGDVLEHIKAVRATVN
jgi:hypothetical protein